MGTSDAVYPVALKCPQCGASLSPNPEGFMVCPYCGSSLVWDPGRSAPGEPEAKASRGMRLKHFTCVDEAGTGLEMFTMLAPVGWQTRGGCRWLLDNPGMPATVSFQLWNPYGAEMFEVLPNMNLIWDSSRGHRTTVPPGTRHFGAEVRPPVPVRQAFRELVLPRYRSMVDGLRILSEEPQPDLPRLVKSEAVGTSGSAEGGRVRIRYTWQGRELDEEIYGVVEVFRAPMTTLFATTELLIWFVDFLFSFRAAAGRLDATADLFKVMLGSFRSNPHWIAAYKSIVQVLARMQIQRIRHIGEIGNILASAGREMREQNLNDWYVRQAVHDRVATDHSRMIRGVDAFYDPHREETVELPSGYGHAWANNLGEVILTEEAGFNPNEISNLHWEPMSPQ